MLSNDARAGVGRVGRRIQALSVEHYVRLRRANRGSRHITLSMVSADENRYF